MPPIPGVRQWLAAQSDPVRATGRPPAHSPRCRPRPGWTTLRQEGIDETARFRTFPSHRHPGRMPQRRPLADSPLCTNILLRTLLYYGVLGAVMYWLQIGRAHV